MTAPDRIWAFRRHETISPDHVRVISAWVSHPNAAMGDCYLLSTPERERAAELVEALRQAQEHLQWACSLLPTETARDMAYNYIDQIDALLASLEEQR